MSYYTLQKLAVVWIKDVVCHKYFLAVSTQNHYVEGNYYLAWRKYSSDAIGYQVDKTAQIGSVEHTHQVTRSCVVLYSAKLDNSMRAISI